MLPIHYLLFSVPTFLGGCYLGNKLKKGMPIQIKKGIFWPVFWVLLIISLITLSFPIIIFAYSVLFSLILDALFFLTKKFHFTKVYSFIKAISLHGISIFILAAGLTIYSYLVAQNPIIQSYRVDINKQMKNDITILFLSDLHLGTGTNKNTLNSIADTVQRRKPDLFLIGGDLFDEVTSEGLKLYAYEHLGKIKTKYGTYYVEGNHDLLTPSSRMAFHKSHIKILEDQSILIDNTFYLVGRKDRKHKRKTLREIMKEVDPSIPTILLGHRPDQEKEGIKEGIDLQLAGHTHAGQIFPGNFIMKYGYYQKKNYHLIISSGYGNWGIPVRNYTKNELVEIRLTGYNKIL